MLKIRILQLKRFFFKLIIYLFLPQMKLSSIHKNRFNVCQINIDYLFLSSVWFYSGAFGLRTMNWNQDGSILPFQQIKRQRRLHLLLSPKLFFCLEWNFRWESKFGTFARASSHPWSRVYSSVISNVSDHLFINSNQYHQEFVKHLPSMEDSGLISIPKEFYLKYFVRQVPFVCVTQISQHQ